MSISCHVEIHLNKTLHTHTHSSSYVQKPPLNNNTCSTLIDTSYITSSYTASSFSHQVLFVGACENVQRGDARWEKHQEHVNAKRWKQPGEKLEHLQRETPAILTRVSYVIFAMTSNSRETHTEELISLKTVLCKSLLPWCSLVFTFILQKQNLKWRQSFHSVAFGARRKLSKSFFIITFIILLPVTYNLIRITIYAKVSLVWKESSAWVTLFCFVPLFYFQSSSMPFCNMLLAAGFF